MRTWALPLVLAGCLGEADMHGDAQATADSGAPDAGGPVADAGPHGADAGSRDAGASPADAGAELCPDIPIPSECFNRQVVFRDWGPDAMGDGTFFASQAPYRLGFTRTKGAVWIVKFKTDLNTYRGSVNAYGDNSGGWEWISDQPCSADFALQNGLVAYGNHGGGTLSFTVARNDEDANTLRTNSAYRNFASAPMLRGGGCYYAVFENTDDPAPTPLTSSFFTTAGDDCGDFAMTSDCYYLAYDMGHFLDDPLTGQRYHSREIAGLTQ